MLYRILTENKNFVEIKEKAIEILGSGFLITNCKACYDAKMEKEIVIEVIKDDPDAVSRLVFWIRKRNKQKFVLVQELPCIVRLL